MGVGIVIILIVLILNILKTKPELISSFLRSTTGNTASKNVGLPPEDMKNPTPVLGMGQKAYQLNNKSTAAAVARPEITTKSSVTSNKTSAARKELISMHREPPVSRLMDDREHDWLAGQLRDERAAKRRMSDMFDLKMEHAHNCEAEMLRQFHASNCDANQVDTARA